MGKRTTARRPGLSCGSQAYDQQAALVSPATIRLPFYHGRDKRATSTNVAAMLHNDSEWRCSYHTLGPDDTRRKTQ